MKQSQFASFRASRYPTFSSFARLNLVLPACETEWGKKTLKKESNLLNPTRSWAFVLIAQRATTCMGHSLYSTKSSPITSDVSSEQPVMQSVSSVSTCHEHAWVARARSADGYLGTSSTHAARCDCTTIAAPVLEFPSGYIVKDTSVNCWETDSSYNCVSQVYRSLKTKKQTNL